MPPQVAGLDQRPGIIEYIATGAFAIIIWLLSDISFPVPSHASLSVVNIFPLWLATKKGQSPLSVGCVLPRSQGTGFVPF